MTAEKKKKGGRLLHPVSGRKITLCGRELLIKRDEEK